MIPLVTDRMPSERGPAEEGATVDKQRKQVSTRYEARPRKRRGSAININTGRTSSVLVQVLCCRPEVSRKIPTATNRLIGLPVLLSLFPVHGALQ